MMENHLRSAFEQKTFLYSAELVLGRDHTVEAAETFIREAANQSDGFRIVSLTDLPSGNPALPPEAFVEIVSEAGLTPIVHLSGKDGNRSFVEGRLHTLARLGVENVLALTGDAQREGFQGQSKPVYDLDSISIIGLIQAMRKGLEYRRGKRTLRTTPFDFLPGAVVNPFKVGEPDQLMQFYKLELKIAVGASYIITQLGFNLRKLYELKQYMNREGLQDVPVIANVYVPTAFVANMMKQGLIAGTVATDELIERLGSENKRERLERAANMVAAVRDLGFSGAHLGGFGLTHDDFLWITRRAAELGDGWKERIDDLIFGYPGEFYLLPEGKNGLSDGDGEYQITKSTRRARLTQTLSRQVHRHLIRDDSWGARFLAPRLDSSEDGLESTGFWHQVVGLSRWYRKATLGCMDCGDCIQDHLNYAGCPMNGCYKNLRNGPCGGSRTDGTCEADPRIPCIWNEIYLAAVACDDDPRKFARTLLPPRDWNLDRTNALVNRLRGVDNLSQRRTVGRGVDSEPEVE